MSYWRDIFKIAKDYNHDEFVTAYNEGKFKFDVIHPHKYKFLAGARKNIFYCFLFLYMLFPIVIIPIWSYLNHNWWLLFGILACFFAVIIQGSKSTIIPFITLPFMIGVWITSGFSIYQYSTFFFFCFWWAYIFCGMASGIEDEYIKIEVLANPRIFYYLSELDLIIILPNIESLTK